MADSSPINTPKRKREVHNSPVTPVKFSFDILNDEAAEDEGSPRSKVARRFMGLGLGGGGVGSDSDDHDTDSVSLIRKKHKAGESSHQSSPTKSVEFCRNSSPSPVASAAIRHDAAGQGTDSNDRSSTSPNVKTPKKRSGTPPLKVKRSPVHDTQPDSDSEAEEAEITDPVRAALTWHDDEITVYDPDDEDDDGTGVNGVGFKPTPAVAHARNIKRRQQMAEYRRREESDARAQRSQRRREGAAARHEEKMAARKVRFREAERQNVSISTT